MIGGPGDARTATLFSIDPDGGAKTWDVLSPNPFSPGAHTAAPTADAVATAHDDLCVRVWDAAQDWAPIELCGHREPVSDMTWTADGRVLVTAAGAVRAWDRRSGELLWSWEDGARWAELATSPDLETLAAVAEGQVGIWSLSRREPDVVESPEVTGPIAWGPHGDVFFVGRPTGVDRWTVSGATRTHSVTTRGEVLTLTVRADGIVLVATDVEVTAYDGATLRLLRSRAFRGTPAAGAHFDAAGSRVFRQVSSSPTHWSGWTVFEVDGWLDLPRTAPSNLRYCEDGSGPVGVATAHRERLFAPAGSCAAGAPGSEGSIGAPPPTKP